MFAEWFNSLSPDRQLGLIVGALGFAMFIGIEALTKK